MSENWIKIIEVLKEDKILEYLNKEFDKNNIKYKIELEEKWMGRITPEYIGKFVVYIQENSKGEAEKILNGYYEKNEEINEEIDNAEACETEKESKKIAKRQKTTIKIYIGIVICMIIIAIVVGLLAK